MTSMLFYFPFSDLSFCVCFISVRYLHFCSLTLCSCCFYLPPSLLFCSFLCLLCFGLRCVSCCQDEVDAVMWLDTREPASPTDQRNEANLLIRARHCGSPRNSPCFANPGGRTSPTDFATAAVAAVLVVQLALDQEDPASPSSEEESSSEDSAVLSLSLALSQAPFSPSLLLHLSFSLSLPFSLSLALSLSQCPPLVFSLSLFLCLFSLSGVDKPPGHGVTCKQLATNFRSRHGSSTDQTFETGNSSAPHKRHRFFPGSAFVFGKPNEKRLKITASNNENAPGIRSRCGSKWFALTAGGPLTATIKTYSSAADPKCPKPIIY